MPFGIDLGGSVDSITGQPKGSEGGSYDEIDEARFHNTFGNDLQAGVWRDLAEFVCGAQNQYNVGYASSENAQKVGRWYMVLADGAGNFVTGTARIKTRDSNDEGVDTEIRGIHTRRLDTVADDYTKQYAVEEQLNTPKVGEDSKIVLQFKLASSSTGTSVDFTAANTVVQIPLTNY